MSASLAALTAAVLALAPFAQDFEMRLSGVQVGKVRLELQKDGDGYGLRYSSESLQRRGPVVSRNRASARLGLGPALETVTLSASRREGEVVVREAKGFRPPPGSVPSALAPLLLAGDERRCLQVIDEVEARVGEACGALTAGQVKGTLFGEPFVARVQKGRLLRLEFPGQQMVFAAVKEAPRLVPPRDLFGDGVPTTGMPAQDGLTTLAVRLQLDGAAPGLPASPSQTVLALPGATEVRWTLAAPAHAEALGRAVRLGQPLDAVLEDALDGATDRWRGARALAGFVARHVQDKRPAGSEHSPEAVFESGRGSCVGHTALFLALARRAGIPARRAVGLVAADGRFYAHAWAQVLVGEQWFDVEPTEGEAPARAPRVLFGFGADKQAETDPEASRLLARIKSMRITVLP